jgi:uncharacterized protein
LFLSASVLFAPKTMQHRFTRALWGWLLACFVLLGSGLLASAAEATGIYQMPQLSAGSPTWIIDDADLLSRLNVGKISDRLATLAADTGTEVRVVTFHRLDYGETPDSFAKALFQKWFPTPEEQANQVVLVLDDVTNGAALQAGPEAATRLTEEIAQSIAAETIAVPPAPRGAVQPCLFKRERSPRRCPLRRS